ncbi:MAG: LPS assembly lipoprotein LptE [Mariniblastus sp.]|nr:LPS assembly lipoprotein LptE [Mariniblastus sp.]
MLSPLSTNQPNRLSLPALGLSLVATAAVVLLAGCRNYNLGNQYLYRSDIRTVHVAMFESESFRLFLGQRLTESVVKQIELNTPYTIGAPHVADSFVRGKLVRERKRPLSEDKYDDPNVLEIEYRVEVTWVDRAGVPLMPLQSIRIARDAVFIPEAGQSMATAQQQVIDRIAHQIVGQMEMPW